ncbi:MAG: aminodeoxychorismate synthase component I [Pseudonocardia sp.]
MSTHLLAVPLDVDVAVPEVVRRLADRERVTAWAGAWAPGAVVTCDPVRIAAPDEDPFVVLTDLPRVVADPAHPDAVGGGWFGYLSFPACSQARFPRFSLGYYHDLLRHDGRGWWYEALLDGGFSRRDAERRCAGLCRDLATPAVVEPARLELLHRPDAIAHAVAVERCIQAIRRGEIYQANIACHLDLRLHGSPHDAWVRLVEEHAPARAALVTDPAGTAVSASPELFLRRAGREVRTAPIKGTRPRTGGPDDEGERQRLRDSAKDAAENVMIVDLMRNDLSRVCATGTVRVSRLLGVEPHAGVWHLVSTVCGELAAGRDDADLLAATFPPGSVSGAPKIRAVKVIEELEAGPRGLFTGAMGWSSPLTGLELNVAIRTLEIEPGGRTRLGVGGGVTVDSTPVEEWAECLIKAAPVLRALGAAPVDPGPGLRRVGLARPDGGLFETLLVLDGRPRRLADHVRRLRTSYVECYGVPLVADVAAAVTMAIARIRSGTRIDADGRPGPLRVRVDASPGEPGRVCAVAVPCDPPVPLHAQPGLVLRAHRLGPAGSERHKFADRRWIDVVETGLSPGEAALLVDDAGRLLECTRSSVFVVRAGRVSTPALDGRILPGTARQAVLDALDSADTGYELAAPTLADVAAADGMFLVNAVRGVQWVRAAPGAVWLAPDRATRRVATLLDQ